jgi:hypothetical protein
MRVISVIPSSVQIDYVDEVAAGTANEEAEASSLAGELG